MTEEQHESPWYTGMYTHNDQAGGYSIVIPTDWHKLPLKKGLVGLMFSPYADDLNTSVLTQKHTLKYAVKPSDVPLLRDSFEQGVRDLPGAQIQKIESTLSDPIYTFDAIFTFMDGDVRRKRWARNIYWSEAQLIVIAQGRTPEDYEHWLPMFYNIMTTLKVL